MNSYNNFPPGLRSKALNWLKKEYAEGRRLPPTICDACGQTHGIVEAHSEDYSEPFGDHIGQFGLCFTCHMMVHCRFKNREAFDRYVDAISKGGVFTGFTSRNFPLFRSLFLGPKFPKTENKNKSIRRLLVAIDQGIYNPYSPKYVGRET